MGLIDFSSAPLREPAECVIKVDGEEIMALYPYLTEVTVDSSRERGSEATLHFESRRDERGRWAVQDEEVFVPWKRITIDAAFGTTTEAILEGFVQQLSASYPEDQGGATVVVTCRDVSFQCDREHVRKSWGDEQQPVSDTEIVQEIVVSRQHLQLAPGNGPGQTGLVKRAGWNGHRVSEATRHGKRLRAVVRGQHRLLRAHARRRTNASADHHGVR